MANVVKLKIYLFSICLSLASVLLCLLVGETFLTMQYNKERARLESTLERSELCTMASEFPELIYTRIPGKCGANSHGFRDYEYSYSKKEGVFRIVIIGDSVAAGQSVELQDSFGKVLERKLNALPKGRGRKVEIVVLAQHGYTIAQELFLLKNDAFRYSPDLIIWSYVLNDPAHPVYHNANNGLGRYYLEPRLHTANFIFKKLFDLNEKYKMTNCQMDEYHKLLHCIYWGQIDSNIRNIAQISKTKSIPIIFLIHPIFEENGDYNNYSLAPVHEKLIAVAYDSGLPYLDLLDAYSAYDPDELNLPNEGEFDPWHPNIKGHLIAADTLLKFIADGPQFQKWIGQNN